MSRFFPSRKNGVYAGKNVNKQPTNHHLAKKKLIENLESMRKKQEGGRKKDKILRSWESVTRGSLCEFMQAQKPRDLGGWGGLGGEKGGKMGESLCNYADDSDTGIWYHFYHHLDKLPSQ